MNLRSPSPPGTRSQHGFLTTEAVIALSILVVAAVPFAYSFLLESRILLFAYQRSVAMQIVDGETERLQAGGWKQYEIGTHALRTRAESATNLPPGQFTITRELKRLTIEWKPAPGQHGRTIQRTLDLP